MPRVCCDVDVNANNAVDADVVDASVVNVLDDNVLDVYVSVVYVVAPHFCQVTPAYVPAECAWHCQGTSEQSLCNKHLWSFQCGSRNYS